MSSVILELGNLAGTQWIVTSVNSDYSTSLANSTSLCFSRAEASCFSWLKVSHVKSTILPLRSTMLSRFLKGNLFLSTIPRYIVVSLSAAARQLLPFRVWSSRIDSNRSRFRHSQHRHSRPLGCTPASCKLPFCLFLTCREACDDWESLIWLYKRAPTRAFEKNF